MTKENVFLCGDLPQKRKIKNIKEPIRLYFEGDNANIGFKIRFITEAMARNIPSIFLDLIEIAAYVFCGDQMISRGGNDDISKMGKDWRRKMTFHIPVRNPQKWNSTPIIEALKTVLNFMADDEYEFTFYEYENPLPEQTYIEFGNDEFDAIEEVTLFSGGLDSLAGAVEEIINKKCKVALINHSSSPKIRGQVETLFNHFSKYTNGNKPSFIPVWLNKHGMDARDTSQRTRTFLFASIAASIAKMLKLNRIKIFENGIISLNLPVAAQVVGAKATRTTHPQTIELISKLYGLLSEGDFEIETPFLWKTKAEVVQIIKDAGCGSLIGLSRSCSRVYEATLKHPHCGTCIQCIDRRFAMLAAECQEYDPADKYKVDLLTGKRDSHESVIIAESYIRTADEINKMFSFENPDNKFFTKYPEAYRVLKSCNGKTNDNAIQMLDLYRRFSGQVCKVLQNGIRNHAEQIQGGKLDAFCMLVMSIPYIKTSVDRDNELFRHSPDYRSIFFNEKEYILTPQQAHFVEILHSNYLQKTPDIGIAYFREQLSLSENIKIKNIFRDEATELLDNLIISKTKGTYRLNI